MLIVIGETLLCVYNILYTHTCINVIIPCGLKNARRKVWEKLVCRRGDYI